MIKNWKTSLCGLLLAIVAYVVGHPAEFSPIVIQVAQFLGSLGALGLGVFAADHPKT